MYMGKCDQCLRPKAMQVRDALVYVTTTQKMLCIDFSRLNLLRVDFSGDRPLDALHNRHSRLKTRMPRLLLASYSKTMSFNMVYQHA